MAKSIQTGIGTTAALTILMLTLPSVLSAHGVSSKDAQYLQTLNGTAVGPLIYLGAKHMVTGYDDLLFLAGVIFYLYRLKDVVLYVSLFTVGHSLTLLAGALGGLHVNAFLIDAIIGLSIVYKGFENLGGFRRVLGYHPNPRVAVLVFGLFHGLRLATKLQEFTLSRNGLVANIVSFNIGVELGHLVALTAVLLALSYWRTRGIPEARIPDERRADDGRISSGRNAVDRLLSGEKHDDRSTDEVQEGHRQS